MRVKFLGAIAIASLLVLMFAVVAQAAVPQSTIDAGDQGCSGRDDRWPLDGRGDPRHAGVHPGRPRVFSSIRPSGGPRGLPRPVSSAPEEQGGQLAFTGGEIFLVPGRGRRAHRRRRDASPQPPDPRDKCLAPRAPHARPWAPRRLESSPVEITTWRGLSSVLTTLLGGCSRSPATTRCPAGRRSLGRRGRPPGAVLVRRAPGNPQSRRRARRAANAASDAATTPTPMPTWTKPKPRRVESERRAVPGQQARIVSRRCPGRPQSAPVAGGSPRGRLPAARRQDGCQRPRSPARRRLRPRSPAAEPRPPPACACATSRTPC